MRIICRKCWNNTNNENALFIHEVCNNCKNNTTCEDCINKDKILELFDINCDIKFNRCCACSLTENKKECTDCLINQEIPIKTLRLKL